MDYPTITYEEIDAIVGGYHGDPFSLLGPHEYEDGVVVRTFAPLADSAEVMLSSQDIYPMEKVKVDGFFEVLLPERQLPIAYLLKLNTYSGETLLYEDPYAFPSTLSDFDAHLLAEGTHMKMYEKLGAHITELNGSVGVLFAVWAPNALRVSVVGEFNQWDGRRPLNALPCQQWYLGNVHSRHWRRCALQVRNKVPPSGLYGNEGRSGRVFQRIATQKRIYRLGHRKISSGKIRPGWKLVENARLQMPQLASTKCTWLRGDVRAAGSG